MKKIDIYSPLNEKIIGEIEAMDKKKVDSIIEKLKFNFKNYKSSKLSDRIKLFRIIKKRLKEEIIPLANLMYLEIAKPLKDCENEILRSIEMIDLFIKEAKKLDGKKIKKGNMVSTIFYEPKGLVLCIAPFNYPINLTISKIVPALLMGNVVLLKPPTQGALSVSYMINIFRQVFDDNVLGFVTGKGSEIGDFLNTHKDIDVINFTGSTAVGHNIIQQAPLKEHIQELGGKDAAIVLDDANLDIAAKEIVSGAFNYAGQRCTAIKRVLVRQGIKNKLISKMVKNLSSIVINPLIDMKSADYVQSLIDDAINKGARVVLGNKREKNLIYPCILDNVSLDMLVAFKEPFGPVLPIITYKSIQEAIDICNMSEYGLQTSIFTTNKEKARNIAKQIEVGTVQINKKTSRGPDEFPFLGIKNSGRGVQGIKWGLMSMANIKSIVEEDE